MENLESKKSNINGVVGKLLIWLVVLRIIIILLGVILYYIIKKDAKEYDKISSTQIEQIKYFFESEWNFELCPYSLYTYTSSWTNEGISILPNDDIYFQYYKPWKRIVFYSHNNCANLLYLEKEGLDIDWCKWTTMLKTSESNYTIELIKKDPEWWNILENPDNYRITNIIYNTWYNENITWESEFKITNNLILKRDESLINKQ